MIDEQRMNTKSGMRNIFVISQKESADIISSPVFLMLIATYTLIIFSFSYQSVLFGQRTGEEYLLMTSLSNIIPKVGWFAPLIGIALGFDAVIKERKSGSLNVLLTHPVFRDNIITGKLLGITSILLFVIMISMMIPLGTILILTGVHISGTELIRIAIFAFLTFFYVLFFAGIAVLMSVVAINDADSLIYNIVIWLFCIVSGTIIMAIGTFITGLSDPFEFASQLVNISPLHYYGEAAAGRIDISLISIRSEPTIKGIFDTRFTLTQWFSEFWTEITVLIVTPITLLIISFIAFMRKDITL